MEYNRGTWAEYNTWHNTAMDNAGWTADEKQNGKIDSFVFNSKTKLWDIPNIQCKTTKLFEDYQNTDLSDDYVWQKQTATLTVLTQQQYEDLMDIWYQDV